MSMKGDYSHFSDKVVDFSIFLKEKGLFEKLGNMKKWPERVRVTYHERPRGLPQNHVSYYGACRTTTLWRWRMPSSCCGLGGTFSVYHYETSKAIGAMKLEGIIDSEASLLATGCPGCIM